MTILIRTLILPGIVAQAWLLFELRHGLHVVAAAGELAPCFIPAALAGAGAGSARWLRRRGSRWAWGTAGLPAAVLGPGPGPAVLLTPYPVTLHRRWMPMQPVRDGAASASDIRPWQP